MAPIIAPKKRIVYPLACKLKGKSKKKKKIKKKIRGG
jgi:hypothetical protein